MSATTSPVVDADTHLTEAPDLWTSRASAQWKDLVPRVARVDGKEKWVIGADKVIGSTRAASVILPDKSKARGAAALSLRMKHVHPASWDIAARVALMDEMGVDAQIAYPNLLGFGGHKIPDIDPRLKLLAVQIYNDAMAEFQELSGNRIFPMAIVPWWDLPAAVAEARRAAGMGLRGVNTNPDPQEHRLPDLASTHWDPLWEACCELELPVNFHIGASDGQLDWFGSAPWPSQTDDHKLAIGGAMLHMSNARVLANLLLSDLPERFPTLNFVSVESGIGWIPFVLEALDYHVHDISPESHGRRSMKPSEYFQRQFYGCFWFEKRTIVPMIQAVGVDNVLFESDFPHSTCLYPNAAQQAAEALAGLGVAERGKVMGGNAARLYRLPIHRARA